MQHAPEGQHGEVSGTLQLSDMLGSALGAGLGGALVAALGVAGGDSLASQPDGACWPRTVLLVAGRMRGRGDVSVTALASDPAHD